IPKKLHGPPPPSRMAGPSEPERSEVEAAAGQEHEADLPLAADRFEGEGAGFPAVAFHELEDPLLHVAVRRLEAEVDRVSVDGGSPADVDPVRAFIAKVQPVECEGDVVADF